MSPVPGFEVAFCEPDVVLSFILTCDSGVVYYASGCAALSVKGAGTFHAVAVSGFVVDQLHVTIQNFIVVALNDRPHVFSAAVTYFQGIPVENFAERILPSKVFIDEFQKYFAKVCAKGYIVWGVVPYDLTSAIFAFGRGHSVTSSCFEYNTLFVPTIFQCFVVFRAGTVKHIFVA